MGCTSTSASTTGSPPDGGVGSPPNVEGPLCRCGVSEGVSWWVGGWGDGCWWLSRGGGRVACCCVWVACASNEGVLRAVTKGSLTQEGGGGG